MAITGAHVLLYSKEAERLRETLRDAFGWRHIDAGDGWLIFALPPAELGVHPDAPEGPIFDAGPHHQLTLMCDDIHATVAELRGKGIEIEGQPMDEGFGVTVMLSLPGDVKVMLYEPRHPVAIDL